MILRRYQSCLVTAIRRVPSSVVTIWYALRSWPTGLPFAIEVLQHEPAYLNTRDLNVSAMSRARTP
jgi:hypothetical protein